MARMLEAAEDIEVVGAATTIEEAIKLAEEQQPDVAILDLKWYGDDAAGLNAIGKIRTMAPQTRILVVSAYSELLERAKEMGANDAIDKGTDALSFIDAVRQIALEPLPAIRISGPVEEEPPLDDFSLFVGALVHRLGNLLGLVPPQVRHTLSQLEQGDYNTARKELEQIQQRVVGAMSVLRRLKEVSLPLELEIKRVDELLASALVASNIPDHINVKTENVSDTPLVSGAPQLVEVFVNLLTNAVEAMPQGGTLRLITRITGDERYVDVWIIDSGHGISDKVKEHLFQPFVTTKPAGHGLGLWLSKHIIERLGGTIRLESKGENQGATFVVRLPLHSEREETQL